MRFFFFFQIRTICEAVRKAILGLHDDKIKELYTVILSTYLKIDPPETTTALLDIKKRSEKGEGAFFTML